MNRRGKRTGRLLGLVALCVVITACGLPGDVEPRVVEDSEVPYDLLEEEPRPTVTPGDPSAPRRVPVVFWLRPDDLLVPAAVQASCADSDEDVVEAVLGSLTGLPSEEERRSGWASAIPSTSSLRLVGIEDAVAQIELGAVDLVDAERLPLAVAQLTLSVTSARGVTGIELFVAGRAVEIPLPGGALADRPVTAEDYASLLPDRLLITVGDEVVVRADIGCPPLPT